MRIKGVISGDKCRTKYYRNYMYKMALMATSLIIKLIMNLKLITFLLFVNIIVMLNSGKAQSLFTQPSMTFINTSTEKITDLSFHNSPVDSILVVINNTRSTYPNNLIRITLSGSFLIDSLPITLSNKMLLILNYATVWANNKTSASSLIAAPNDTMVSIFAEGYALLDGGNNNLLGINVTTSGKIHIDGLTIQNCKNGGIYYNGRGETVYADAGSVTRCNINNCGSTGISYNNSFNFVCTDNSIENTTVGIHLNGNNSAVCNNLIKNCSIGMESVSGNEAITYNNIDSCITGVSLSTASNQTLVAYNKIIGNKIGLNVKGNKASIYYNTCNNTVQVAGSGTYNELYCNSGINITQGNVSGCSYFNPPTIGNPHTDLIKVGETRFDITIKDTLLTAIRGILDSLHNLYSNTVIVAHLNGTFTAPSINDSLVIYDDECILLNGTIKGTDSCGKLISFADGCTSSFSGGTINGNNIEGKTALVYITGSSNVVMDSVRLINSYGQGIEKKSSTTPTFVRACSLDSINGRSLWDVSSTRLYAFENKLSNAVKDGIDLDAASTFCVVEKNTCINNQRNGVFIEEGAKEHIVLGNKLNGSVNGVEFYNLLVTNQNSSMSLVAYNTCDSNTKGILVSAAKNTQASINNVIFNNVCNNNTTNGIAGLYSGLTYNNYLAMNTCINNTSGAFYSKADLTYNYSWNMIANTKLLPIEFISFEGKDNKKGIQINWVFPKESNIAHFEIERSGNGIDFSEIGIVFQSSESYYEYLDNSPIIGNNYYRIKALGIDGSVTYSSNILVGNNTNGDLLVNCFEPTEGVLQITISNKVAIKRIGIEVYDLLGKRIFKNESINLNTTQFHQAIKLPSIVKGIYILAIKTDKGNSSKKFEIR